MLKSFFNMDTAPGPKNRHSFIPANRLCLLRLTAFDKEWYRAKNHRPAGYQEHILRRVAYRQLRRRKESDNK
jgi:hypothetical protein